MAISRSELMAEFVGGPWDGRIADSRDGERLPEDLVVPWAGERHRYHLQVLWYGDDEWGQQYEYQGVMR